MSEQERDQENGVQEPQGQFYKLDERGEPMPAHCFACWMQWVMVEKMKHGRTMGIVAKTVVKPARVFTTLVIEAFKDGDKNPQLWQSMVVGGPLHGYEERCGGSREQAEGLHERIVEKVKTEQTFWVRVRWGIKSAWKAIRSFRIRFSVQNQNQNE